MQGNGRRAKSMQGKAAADGDSLRVHRVVTSFVSLVTIFIFNNKSSRTHSTAPPFPKKSFDFSGTPMVYNGM